MLNDCGEYIPRFVSHYLDKLPPVTFSSLDVSCLLQRMEQLCSEVDIIQFQTDVCKKVYADGLEINHQVTALEYRSGALVGVTAAKPLGPETASHTAWKSHPVELLGTRNDEHGTMMHGAGFDGLHTQSDVSSCSPEPEHCSCDGAVMAAPGNNMGGIVMEKDPIGAMSLTGSPPMK